MPCPDPPIEPRSAGTAPRRPAIRFRPAPVPSSSSGAWLVAWGQLHTLRHAVLAKSDAPMPEAEQRRLWSILRVVVVGGALRDDNDAKAQIVVVFSDLMARTSEINRDVGLVLQFLPHEGRVVPAGTTLRHLEAVRTLLDRHGASSSGKLERQLRDDWMDFVRSRPGAEPAG